MALIDGQRSSIVRRMWRRWWNGLSVAQRDITCEEMCVLPRGSASDDGWLKL